MTWFLRAVKHGCFWFKDVAGVVSAMFYSLFFSRRSSHSSCSSRGCSCSFSALPECKCWLKLTEWKSGDAFPLLTKHTSPRIPDEPAKNPNKICQKQPSVPPPSPYFLFPFPHSLLLTLPLPLLALLLLILLSPLPSAKQQSRAIARNTQKSS